MSAAEAAVPAERPALFSPRVVLWLVLVGVFAFCAFMALSAYAPDLRSGRDGGAHALSRSAVGFAGIAELMQDLGVPVVITRGPPPATRGGAGVLLLTPTPFTESRQIKAFSYGGLIVVVLPKWETAPQPLRPGWVDKIGVLPPEQATAPLKGILPASLERRSGSAAAALKPAAPDVPIFGAGEVMRTGPIEELQTISGGGWRPLLVDEHGDAVVALAIGRPLAVIADPDLLNTHGIADAATALAGRTLLDDLRNGGPVVFDVTLNGFKRGRSLLRLALEPPLLGVTLALLAAVAMAGLHAAARFGPPERQGRALALAKRALADNAAALIRMAKREPRMAPDYAALAREGAARAVGAPRDLDPDQLDVLLDRLSAVRVGAGGGVTALMARAEAARSDADLMAVARELYQWRREMMRDGR